MNKKEEPLKSIEELKQAFAVSDVVFEGVKVANGWKRGKQVDDKTFQVACSDFLKAPVDGRTGKGAKG